MSRRSRRGSDGETAAAVKEEPPAKRARGSKAEDAGEEAKAEKPKAEPKGRRGSKGEAAASPAKASPAKPEKKAAPKKGKKVDEAVEKLEAVVDFLKDESNAVEGGPKNRELLTIGAAPALADGCRDRAAAQNKMVGCIESALSEIHASRQAAEQAAKQELEQAAGVKGRAEQALADVEAKLAAQKSTLEQLKDKEKQDVDSLRAADKAVTEAVKEISKFEESNAAVGKKIEHVNASIATFEGTASAASDKKTIASLIGELKACDVEESLLKAAPSALSLEPAARGDFDKMCLSTIEGKLAQRRNALTTQASQADTDKQALEASLAEKNALKAQLEQASEQSQAASEVAAKGCKDVEAEVKAATKAVKTAGDGSSKAQKEADKASESVAEYSAVYSAFVWLRDRGNTPADAAAEAPAEAAAEAPVAAAADDAQPGGDATMEWLNDANMAE